MKMYKCPECEIYQYSADVTAFDVVNYGSVEFWEQFNSLDYDWNEDRSFFNAKFQFKCPSCGHVLTTDSDEMKQMFKEVPEGESNEV